MRDSGSSKRMCHRRIAYSTLFPNSPSCHGRTPFGIHFHNQYISCSQRRQRAAGHVTRLQSISPLKFIGSLHEFRIFIYHPGALLAIPLLKSHMGFDRYFIATCKFFAHPAFHRLQYSRVPIGISDHRAGPS